MKLYPLEVLKRVTALPYRRERDGCVSVAIAEPGNMHTLDALRFASRHPLTFFVASDDQIRAVLCRFDGSKGLTDPSFDGVLDEELRERSARARRTIADVEAELAERAASRPDNR